MTFEELVEQWKKEAKQSVDETDLKKQAQLNLIGQSLEMIESIINSKDEKTLSWRYMVVKGNERAVFQQVKSVKSLIKKVDETKDMGIKWKMSFDKGKGADRLILKARWK